MLSTRVIRIAFIILATLALPTWAFWRLPCAAPLVVERADPIVSAGKVSGHLHTIMGGDGFGFSESYADTQASTCSSCMVTKDFSNYWVPKLFYQARNGSFIDVNQVGGMTVYYLQRSDPQDPEYENGLLAFPEGFRMVAGNPMLRSYSDTLEQQAISFNCLGTTNPETPELPPYNCPDGLRSQVFFPSCWNGKDLDSPDHKSHMSYPSIYNAGHCPSDFPKRFISLFYEVVWDTDAFKDLWYDGHQPFVFSMGDPTGYGYHGDFLNGWDVPTLQKAVDQCTDDSGVIEDCPVFQFFTDTVTNGCKVPPQIDEQVSGWMDELPGCNPVQQGPATATAASGCGAPTAIGLAENPFVDLTASNDFEYVGCGLDSISSRTLTGPNEAADDMTNKKCVEFCSSQGFAIAGTEYSRECYCGNSIPAAQAPTPGPMGNCFMPCSGDSTENCGGAGTISLYRKCTGSCQNAVYGVNNGTLGSSLPGGAESGSGSKSNPTDSSGSFKWANASSSAPSSSGGQAASSPASGSGKGRSSQGISPAGASANSGSSPNEPLTIFQTKTVIPLPATVQHTQDSGAGIDQACGATYTVTLAAMTVTVTETQMITPHLAAIPATIAPTLKNDLAGSNSPKNAAPVSTPSVITSAPYDFGNGTSTGHPTGSIRYVASSFGHQHLHPSSFHHSHNHKTAHPTAGV